MSIDVSSIQHQFKALHLHDRDCQLTMITACHSALQKNEILCIEAPTGTGKTLSYLIASYHARQPQQKIIICTATIALQEQLFFQDLPLLEKIVKKSIHYALAKGRKNYLCLQKLENEQENQDLFATGNLMEIIEKQTQLRDWNGDKEHIDARITDAQWQHFTTDSAGCSGAQCAHINHCYFFKARQKTHAADIIITNHNLLLADLELGGGVMLPPMQNNLLIIDECHHFPQKSISHYAKSAPTHRSIEQLQAIAKFIDQLITQQHINASWRATIDGSITALTEPLHALKAHLMHHAHRFVEGIWQMEPAEKEHLAMTKTIEVTAQQLTNQLCQIERALNPNRDTSLLAPAEKQAHQKRLSQIKFYIGWTEHLAVTWMQFLEIKAPKAAPAACWFEHKSYKTHEEFYCNSSYINVSAQLKEQLWEKIKNGAILCSATIRSMGQFSHFLRKTGLQHLEHARTASVHSHFEYTASTLFAPRMQYAPNDQPPERYQAESQALIQALILPRAGTLVLFTARQAMIDTYESLSDTLQQATLMQGQMGKHQLLETHQKRIDHHQQSILFGLASLAEGIDLPGRLCEHVIIHKLPFAVPNTPVERTRKAWLEQNQLNAFTLATLPETAMKLTQSIGRLIRKEGDRGLITILDKRIYSKQYGRALLQGLPPFIQLIDQSIETFKKHPSVATFYQITPTDITTASN